MIIFLSIAQAADFKDIIESKELGSCQAKNLAYSAMKFYKVPLNEKYEEYDLYLRVILFFNLDGSLSLRTTVQALLGCQKSSNGEQICSFSPIHDQWTKTTYGLNDKITINNIGSIELRDETNTNRGFVLTFADNFVYSQLRSKEFVGGMITVNFNKNGINTANICKN
jgi:hypothetical protein